MIKGISFQLLRNTPNELSNILKDLESFRCIWYCVKEQTEVFDRVTGKAFFDNDYYNDLDFYDYIQNNMKDSTYIIFLKIQMHLSCQWLKNINSYEEFCDSDCQLLFLIYDCDFVEIYSKDKNILDIIYNNATKNCLRNIEYITDENDKRFSMNIR